MKEHQFNAVFRRTACMMTGAALLGLGLSGCAVKMKSPKTDPFMAEWQTRAEENPGYSPAEEELSPEPRVLMRQADAAALAVEKPLPKMPVTLRVQDADVETVLRALAGAADVSIIMTPGVEGKVTLNVKDARWNDVFQSILRANGLDWRWQGRILQVMTAQEKEREAGMMALNNRLAQAYLDASHTGPMTVQIVNVRYSDTQSLQKSLQKFVAKNPDAVIEIDEHNNALILQGTPTEQARMLALIEKLDRPRPQVQLKAYIIETTKEKARELGMQWGGSLTKGSRHNLIAGSGGSNLAGKGTNTISGVPMGLNYAAQVGGTGAGTLGFAYGKIGGNILETQLNLMEKEGVLNILSSPSLTTLDNKMAYTENGERVPYVTKGDDGDNEVKFEDAVLRLEMTPNIIDRRNMKLKILIKKDEVDSSRSVDGNPFIIKKQTETTVMVQSGETIVISGLTKERKTGTEAGVPGLKNLPGGRYVFGSTVDSVTMEEVLIFITPVILPTRAAELK